ncbi:hypothetical protein TNCT_240911 [Trichonephila clavata]|uniref:Uncharacterized protein n=1 Tax=Trichonephila clavata TaxID=2740835 RepID=A0A8X6HSS3_TRICU|nr:hypothetical protein TNCT_240911 [Trichonephila clavata]
MCIYVLHFISFFQVLSFDPVGDSLSYSEEKERILYCVLKGSVPFKYLQLRFIYIEALQLFFDLPSDNESVDSENSCDEDYMPQPLEYTSDSDTASSEDEDIN